MIRHVTTNDAGNICAIYNHYIINTIVTFEEEPVTEKEMRSRIEQVSAKFPWLVYEEENRIEGYAYATEWRPRTAYRYSAETTVYLKPQSTNKGIGTALYKSLIEEMKALQVHSLIGGIALPNNSSIALHEKLNFKKVAHFTEVGFKLNKWVDVAYWQLLLNIR
jgi:L-amino acid N-acyltransferase YncA